MNILGPWLGIQVSDAGGYGSVETRSLYYVHKSNYNPNLTLFW